MTTPRIDIEEWYKRQEEELSATTLDEFHRRIEEYFKETGKNPPTGKKLERLTKIASDMYLIKRVGILRRTIRFIRRLLRP